MTAHHPVDSLLMKHSYDQVRRLSETLASPYSEADQTVQSMPDASPLKWHLAHTTWFFETFILKPMVSNYKVFNPKYEYLFNSYYNSVGSQFPRSNRGLITRPGKEEVLEYRGYVDAAMHSVLEERSDRLDRRLVQLLELGLAHEQQHQELMVTDIQHAMSFNPLYPKVTDNPKVFEAPAELGWVSVAEGLYEVGNANEAFCFDNETPRHKVYLHSFRAADRLVTNSEYIRFIKAGGYQDPLLWLSEGWAWKSEHQIEAPLYWQQSEGEWQAYSLAGLQALDPNAPVRHVSYFEANAYAQWANARLLTEFEWEVLASSHPEIVDQYDPAVLATKPAQANAKDIQLFNQLWQWTASQYLPYPGFEVQEGAVGEYNGKFMSNQFVLRGGSFVTPPSHVRTTYRNFFPATTRWQFTGIRIARND